jgi:hypothetical protein
MKIDGYFMGVKCNFPNKERKNNKIRRRRRKRAAHREREKEKEKGFA